MLYKVGLSVLVADRLIQVREKISMQTSKNSDMIRQAWYMLGRKKEILPDAFHNVIKNLGISCSARVANELFKKYDDDGNGFLDCYEFVRGLMPKDIDGKTWNVHSEEARAKFDANFKRGANLPHVIPKHLAKFHLKFPHNKMGATDDQSNYHPGRNAR